MDNSTIAADNASILSFPYKDSRPSTPSRMPLNPGVPGYPPRTESPLRTGLSVGRTDNYVARAPARGIYENASLTSEYTPGYTSSDVYELNSLSGGSADDQRDPNDLTSLLSHERGQSRNPSPMERGAYM